MIYSPKEPRSKPFVLKLYALFFLCLNAWGASVCPQIRVIELRSIFLFVVIRIINSFQEDFAVVYAVGESIVKKLMQP